MTITNSSLTSSYDNVDRTSYTTASVSPTANRLLLLAVYTRIGASAVAPTSVTGNGLTWVKVNDVGSTTANLSVWRALGATPSAGTIVIDFNGVTQTGCAWELSQFTNMNVTGTNGSASIVQSVATSFGAATSASVALAAFGNANNATYGAFGKATNEAITNGSGFTTIANPFGATPVASMLTEFRSDNDTGVDASWVTSVASLGIGIEIKSVVISKIDGQLTSAISKINGQAIASISKVDGVAV